jgi:hypothetical protein
MNAACGMHDDDRRAAGNFRLRLGERRLRGRVGGQRGAGAGSSLEFLDFRDYLPGDDLRYLDWRGYARTEQLRVRVHEAEVAPWLDLLVDGSASMAVTPAKERAVRALLGALVGWSLQAGCGSRLLALGGGSVAGDALRFDGPALPPAAARPLVPLRTGGIRILVTDGLWAEDPLPLWRVLLGGGGRAIVVRVLDPWEAEPTPGTTCTLVDCEAAGRAEVSLDARAVAAYRERLQRLTAVQRDSLLAAGGTFVTTTASSLAVMCARDLVPAGLVEAA